MNTKHLFLDLEDTVICPVVQGWHNVELINIDKIRQVIEQFDPRSVHIFSFAIHNEDELSRFCLFVKDGLENAIGRKIELVPTVDGEIRHACCEIMHISPDRVDFSDMSDFWSKQEAFRLFSRFVFRNSWKNWSTDTEVMLLDDAVDDENFEFPNLHLRGFIRNIDKL